MKEFKPKIKSRVRFSNYINHFGQRKYFYISPKYLLFLLLGAIIFASGCMTTLSFETLSIGHYCGHVEKGNYVINSFHEWTELMERSHLSSIKLPRINFTNYTVIAAFMGERRTGGYSIKIKKIKDSGKKITVYIKERTPKKRVLKTMSLTQPYHVIKVEKIKKPVVFRTY